MMDSRSSTKAGRLEVLPDLPAADRNVLAALRFGASHPPLRLLAGNYDSEYWCVDESVVRQEFGHGWTARSDAFLFGHLSIPEKDDMAATTEMAYREVERRCRQNGYPHLLRAWHYFDAINDRDDRRYKLFCEGRARVIAKPPTMGYAAATVIGMTTRGGRLDIAWLASRSPGIAVENPRQTSAWQYPERYGPVPPAFSRAVLLNQTGHPLLLLSGTASILGDRSAHVDALAQLEEILRNLEAVTQAAQPLMRIPAATRTAPLFRVYLRDEKSLEAVVARLQRIEALRYAIFQGEICRADLSIEIEAAYCFGHTTAAS